MGALGGHHPLNTPYLPHHHSDSRRAKKMESHVGEDVPYGYLICDNLEQNDKDLLV